MKNTKGIIINNYLIIPCTAIPIALDGDEKGRTDALYIVHHDGKSIVNDDLLVFGCEMPETEIDLTEIFESYWENVYEGGLDEADPDYPYCQKIKINDIPLAKCDIWDLWYGFLHSTNDD